MHIASSICVQHPQSDSGKNLMLSHDDQQVHREASRKRRVRLRSADSESVHPLTSVISRPAGHPGDSSGREL